VFNATLNNISAI